MAGTGLPSWPTVIEEASREVLDDYQVYIEYGNVHRRVSPDEFDMIVTDISAKACHTMITNLFGGEIADKYVPEAVKS